jgi:hypothetical protein
MVTAGTLARLQLAADGETAKRIQLIKATRVGGP